LTRKASHILFGLIVAYIIMSHGDNGFYLSQSIVIISILAYNWAGKNLEIKALKRVFESINSVLERKEIRINGEAAVLFSSSIMMVYWLLGRESALIASIVWALGDGMCSIVGGYFKRREKSLEGMFSFILFSFIGLVFVVSPEKAIAIAAFSALVEYFTKRMDDNITVPIGAGMIARLLG
jgi:dolichol kinase